LVLDDFAMRDFTVAQADDLYDYAAHATMPRSGRSGQVSEGARQLVRGIVHEG
jgi:hypothetical protein